LACFPADCFRVTSGFCKAQLANSAPRNHGPAQKTPYLENFSALAASIALDARDAKLAVGRELTKGNYHHPYLFEDKSRRLFRRKQDNRRTSPDPESEQAI
jgi:hypothetical protein